MPKSDLDDLPRSPSSVCPACGGENRPNATICRHCMAPFASMNNSDPMGTVFARGDVFANAANKPTKLIVLIGVWVIFGPTFAIFLGMMIYSVIAFIDGDSSGICGLALIIVFTALPAAILFKTTRNYLRFKNAPPPDDD